MGIGQGLVVLSVGLQSFGKVLYGTFLTGISVPLFLLLSFCLSAGVFLAIARLRLPRDGRRDLLLVNLWTAVTFVSFFFALKHLPPAVLAAIEIGMSLIAAIAIVSVQQRAWPATTRVVVCAGIIAGCALLSFAEITAALSDPNPEMVVTAIVASAATGLASALCAIGSKKLAASGWSPSTVLAHRFYLTIAIAAVWLPFAETEIALPDAEKLALIGLVGFVAILTPMLLLQIAIQRSDALTVLICLAAQPILSFVLSIPSPAYDFDVMTLLGVGVVTAFVALDIVGQRRALPCAKAVAAD